MKQAKVALITGITGQDGSYLAELLLDKGYEVFRNASCIGKIDMIVYRPNKKDYLYLDIKTGKSKETLTPNKWQEKLGVRCATIQDGKVRYMGDKKRLRVA